MSCQKIYLFYFLQPNDSLADFIVNDTTFHSSDDENESLISTLTSPPTLRSQWQQRINLRITSTVNRRPRRNQALNLPSSIQVLFSPPVTRNRSQGTQLLLDFETFSSSSPLPSSREQGSVSPFSPIVTRGRSRNNNRIISSNESSLSARDSSPDITELESNIDMPSSDSNITVGSSSSDSLSSNHLSISARSTDPPNSNSQDNTDTDLPLHNPSPSLSRNGPIRPPLSQVSLRPVIKRIKLREFDSINSGGTSTPSSPCASSHSSVNVIEESPVEEEEEEREKVKSDEDTTQPLSFPSPPLSIARPSLSPSVQVVKDHANSRRSTHSSALPLCPLTTSMSAIKKRAKSRIIRDSTSEDEIIEELPSRRRRRRQIKDSPSKWLSSRKPRGASGGVRRRKRCHGNSRTAGESESDYNPFDL